MTPRDRATLGVGGLLVLLAAAWFLLLAPQRDAAARADRDRSDARSRVAAVQAQAQAATGSGSQADVRDQIAVARLGKAVPTDVNMPALLVQLQDLARKDHVDFKGVALGDATGVAATPSTGAGATTTPATTTTTATAPAAPAAPAATTPAGASPPGTVVDAAGYTTLPLDLTFGGAYLDIQRFLASIDDLVQLRGSTIDVRGRLLTVQQAALSLDKEHAPKLVAAVSATAYLAPEDVSAIQQLTQTPTLAVEASAAAKGVDAAPAPAAAVTETATR